jgi:tetratricopeptide (TPR) repeat protein
LLLQISCKQVSPNISPVQIDSSEAKLKASWHYYQGSVANMNLLEAAVALNPGNYEAWRELSIPYLKRGYPAEWFAHYNKAIEAGATEWVGARGCDYLFFYRDYTRALADFNALDTITPNFTDYPQATSDLYLRALCYYGLKDFRVALRFLDRHIEEQSNSSGGFKFIDPHIFLYKGLANLKLNELSAAEEAFNLGLSIFDQSSDLQFHLARVLLLQNKHEAACRHFALAYTCFKTGYKNQHNYVEVQEELYLYDFEELKKQLKCTTK